MFYVVIVIKNPPATNLPKRDKLATSSELEEAAYIGGT
jgi:hypothetical protein